jgi:hypothetical protein
MLISTAYLLGMIVGFVGGLGLGFAYRDYIIMLKLKKARAQEKIDEEVAAKLAEALKIKV